MENNKLLIGYHSTSEDAAMKILSDNFKMPSISSNDSEERTKKFFKYWLGTGVYFFEDVEVAKWWSSKPSDTFGEEGTHKILKCEITGNNVIDLRKVTEWRNLIKRFDLFMSEVGKNFIVNLPEEMPTDSKDSNEYKQYMDTKHKLRCFFFNWYHEAYKVDIIIAAFNQEEFEYIEKGQYNIDKFLDLYYTEVQYCVYDPKVITQKSIEV